MKSKIRALIPNSALITDMITMLIITFGVVLIFNGLILMTTNQPNNDSSETLTSEFAVSVTNSIPGIPFCIGEMTNYSLATVGLVSWAVGLNLLFIGLGLWIRHKFARITAFIVFSLATVFQFVQFLLLGIAGSPISIAEIMFNGIFSYLLLSKFDFSLHKLHQDQTSTS